VPFIEMGEEFAKAKETPLAPEGQYDLKLHALAEDKVPGQKNNLVIDIRFESEDYLPMRHWIALPIPEKDARNDTEKGHNPGTTAHTKTLPIPEKDARNDVEKGHDPGTTAHTKMLMAKRFCYLFGIPYTDTGFNTDDFLGASARVGVTQSSYTRPDGSEATNNKLIIPKLPDEVEAAA